MTQPLSHAAKTAPKEEVSDALGWHEQSNYKHFFEDACIGMFRTTVQGRFLMANKALARLLGASSVEEMLTGCKGLTHGFFLYLHDREEIIQRAHREGRVNNYQFLAQRLDGKQFWASVNLRAVFDTNGNLIGHEGFVEDVSDHWRLYQALENSERRFRNIFESMPSIAAFALDRQRRIIYWNRSAETLYGYPRSEAVGHAIEKLLALTDTENRIAREVDSYFELARALNSRETTRRHRDGHAVEVRTSYVLVPAQDGQQELYFFEYDLSNIKQIERDLRRAKEQAELANRSKTEFLATMSHELRTPLNAIIGFAETMSQGILGPIDNPKYQEYSEDIWRSGCHLLGIINDILDISRVEAGRVTPTNELFLLCEQVKSCIKVATAARPGSTHQITLDCNEQLPQLNADRRFVRQMLLNLLSNAMKFTPDGASIHVAVKLSDTGGLSFSIADQGIGMSREEISLALKPFVQVDSSLSRQYEGAGLGLPLAKAFAEIHGASFKITSSPGLGTNIVVGFPSWRTCI